MTPQGTDQFHKKNNVVEGTMQTATGVETEFDFTSIPAGVKRITVMIAGFSTNGTDAFTVQLGDSGGLETTGYLGLMQGAGVTGANYSSSFELMRAPASAGTFHGVMTLTRMDESTNLWLCNAITSRSDSTGTATQYGAGSKALSATLDRLRVTTSGGVNTIDSGSKINISYEL